jgi:hypothetical protein
MINATKKIIKKCWIIADDELVNLRQSYTRIVKKLGNLQHKKESSINEYKHLEEGDRYGKLAFNQVTEWIESSEVHSYPTEISVSNSALESVGAPDYDSEEQ